MSTSDKAERGIRIKFRFLQLSYPPIRREWDLKVQSLLTLLLLRTMKVVVKAASAPEAGGFVLTGQICPV